MRVPFLFSNNALKWLYIEIEVQLLNTEGNKRISFYWKFLPVSVFFFLIFCVIYSNDIYKCYCWRVPTKIIVISVDFGVWMGWDAKEILGWSSWDVVAFQSSSSLFVQVFVFPFSYIILTFFIKCHYIVLVKMTLLQRYLVTCGDTFGQKGQKAN